MLESAAERLCEPGGVHYGSPDKQPAVRLATIRAAGELRVPFTSGILIGIGETRAERLDALLALRDLHARHGHLQEIIVQNFRAKAPAPSARRRPEPDLEELLWTLAMTRLAFGPAMNIQAPPNLSPTVYPRLIAAGLNDWGGISPITIDHVNPEAPWPAVAALRRADPCRGPQPGAASRDLPRTRARLERWGRSGLAHAGAARHRQRRLCARGRLGGSAWRAPVPSLAPASRARRGPRAGYRCAAAQGDARRRSRGAGGSPGCSAARGDEVAAICATARRAAPRPRSATSCATSSRATSITPMSAIFKCRFCAFSKGKLSESLRGRPYRPGARRGRASRRRGLGSRRDRGLPAGWHPSRLYPASAISISAGPSAAPHRKFIIHAFSPLEIAQGASTLGLSIAAFLERLREAGLGSLPGTAAEVLDDGVRARLCPDKLKTAEWLDVIETAHRIGLRTTSTIMFGHLEAPDDWGAASAASARAAGAHPAASRNSCRCRSSTWRRRSISRARRARGRHFARRC